jgi:hypothetical protein
MFVNRATPRGAQMGWNRVIPEVMRSFFADFRAWPKYAARSNWIGGHFGTVHRNFGNGRFLSVTGAGSNKGREREKSVQRG